MTGHSIERRRAPRAKADFAIRLSENDGPREATVKDLSTSGLCCLFPQPIPEMTLVKIDLQLPGQDETWSIQGAVVRCERPRGDRTGPHEIAIWFTDLAPTCRARIQEFVTAQLVS